MFSCARVMKKTPSEHRAGLYSENRVEGHSTRNKTACIFSDLNIKLQHIT